MPRRTPTLSIHLLGPLEVVVAGRPIVVDTRKALAIVALVAAEGRPFARDELAAMFWPEADDESARGALRRTLSTLRSAVDGIGLVIERSRVGLDSDATEVDLVEVERLAGVGRPADLEAAAILARGPFLAGFAIRDSPAFDDWQAARAARVDRLVADVLDRLASARLASGDEEGAVAAARRRVTADPLDEVGQCRLIELLAAAGDRTAAIRQYRELVALFDRELGVSPLRETTELYEAVREGEPPAAPRAPMKFVGSEAEVAATLPPVRDASTTAPLVGRDGELRTIMVAWHAARPDGRLVLLEGEAGIGKTRLAEAAAVAIRAAGGNVLATRGYPGEGTIAYAPIAELLRAGLALPEAATRLADLDDVARLEIGRLVELPTRFRATGRRAPVADPASARVRLLDAVASALASLATAEVPGLIWVDDLHLADEPTLEALAYLARRSAGRPVLLLLAARREDLGSTGAAIVDDLGRLRTASTIRLERLERDDIAAIVRAWGPADDALVDAYAIDSEGLPLHVVAALASGDPPGTSVPRGVLELLRERIASVGETAAQVLTAAAVIGRSFDLATLRQASGRSEEETVDALEELTRRGLVREVPGSIGPSLRYDFAHGRMRDVAYELSSLARRRLLHRRTAAALRLAPSATGPDDLARFALIAAHERDAGRPGEAAMAFLEAATWAESVFANREASDFIESALALGVPDPAAAQAHVGELRTRLGDYPAAIRALERAAALAAPSDLPAIEIALGRAHRRRGDLDAAASHLDAALQTPNLPDALEARALVERSVVALRAGELEIARADAARASALAERIRDPHVAGLGQRLLGLVARAEGDLDTAAIALEQAVLLASDDPDPTASIAALTGLALVKAAAGSADEAIATADGAIGACRRIGDRHLEAAVENHLADILHEAGRHEESMVHLKRAVELFAEVGEGEPERDPGIWALAAW